MAKSKLNIDKSFGVGHHLALLLLRLGLGFMMITHGWPKAQKLFSGSDIVFADPLGVGTKVSLVLTVFAEVICSVLIILGIGTRWAVVPLIATMLVAIFIVHGGDPIGDKEMGILYGVGYIILLAFGEGKYAVSKLV